MCELEPHNWVKYSFFLKKTKKKKEEKDWRREARNDWDTDSCFLFSLSLSITPKNFGVSGAEDQKTQQRKMKRERVYTVRAPLVFGSLSLSSLSTCGRAISGGCEKTQRRGCHPPCSAAARKAAVFVAWPQKKTLPYQTLCIPKHISGVDWRVVNGVGKPPMEVERGKRARERPSG